MHRLAFAVFVISLLPAGIMPSSFSQEFPSPLQQIQSGTPLHEIACNENMELILRPFTEFPVCVKDTTADALKERMGFVVHFEPKPAMIDIDDDNQSTLHTLSSPSGPVSSEISISHPPKIGETAEITLVTTILAEIYQQPTFEIPLTIPNGFELIDPRYFTFNQEYTDNGYDTDKDYTYEVDVSDSEIYQIINSTVTVRAVEEGNWTVSGPSSQFHIAIGHDESYLIDHLPTSICDTIGIATSRPYEDRPIHYDSMLQSEQIISDSRIQLTEEQVRDMLAAIACVEPFLEIRE